MTEGEWLASSDLHEMLAFLDGTVSDRRLRLFAVACCRRIWPSLTATDGRQVVDVTERAADGQATDAEVSAAGRLATAYADLAEARQTEVGCAAAHAAASLAGSYQGETQVWVATRVAGDARITAYWTAFEGGAAEGQADARARQAGEAGEVAEAGLQAAMLRDIVPNPFRRPSADPRWRTPDAVALAQGIYEDRAFDRLPLLADALMDAGCDNDGILAHCRSEGPHVRGCWVVDSVLGKE